MSSVASSSDSGGGGKLPATAAMMMMNNNNRASSTANIHSTSHSTNNSRMHQQNHRLHRSLPPQTSLLRAHRQTSFYRSFFQSGDSASNIHNLPFDTSSLLDSTSTPGGNGGGNSSEEFGPNTTEDTDSACSPVIPPPPLLQHHHGSVRGGGGPEEEDDEQQEAEEVLVDLPAGVAVPRYRPMGRRNLSFRGLPSSTVLSNTNNTGNNNNNNSPTSSPVHITGMAGLLKAATSTARSSCSSRSSVSSLSNPGRHGSLKAPPEEMALEDGFDYNPHDQSIEVAIHHQHQQQDSAAMAMATAAAASSSSLARPARISSKGRQQSWYREALAQGMSKGDLAALLGEGGDDDDDDDHDHGMARGFAEPSSNLKQPPGVASAAAAASNPILYSNSQASGDGSLSSTGGGVVMENNLEEEVLEQYRIMAHHEARQRAIARLGYDPAERRQSIKPEAITDTAATNTIVLALPQLVPPTLLLPPATVAACEPPPIFGNSNNSNSNHAGYDGMRPSFNGGCSSKGGGGGATTTTRNIFMDSFAKQRLRYWMEQPCRRPRELQVGTVACTSSTTKTATASSIIAPPGSMLVRCLGCRKQLVVGMMATLVSCEDCLTVSPASSTRK